MGGRGEGRGDLKRKERRVRDMTERRGDDLKRRGERVRDMTEGIGE